MITSVLEGNSKLREWGSCIAMRAAGQQQCNFHKPHSQTGETVAVRKITDTTVWRVVSAELTAMLALVNANTLPVLQAFEITL